MLEFTSENEFVGAPESELTATLAPATGVTSTGGTVAGVFDNSVDELMVSGNNLFEARRGASVCDVTSAVGVEPKLGIILVIALISKRPVGFDFGHK